MSDLETMGSYISSNESNSTGNESANKVTEAEYAKVQEGVAKGKQIQGQIAGSKAQNSKLAMFLSFLMKTLDNEKIIKYIHILFFWTKDEKTGYHFMKSDINSLIIIGLFAPFYPNEVEQYGLIPVFQPIYDFNSGINLHKYFQYLKKLSDKHHDNSNLGKETILNLILEIIFEFKLVNKNSLTQEQLDDFISKVSIEIIGQTLKSLHTHTHTHDRQ